MANQKTVANACKNGFPDCGEMRFTSGNWADSKVALKLMPMVNPIVRASEFMEPATPERLLSTASMVKNMFRVFLKAIE